MPQKVSVPVGAGHIHIETGLLAKQADGAVTVQLGETMVIVAAVGATKAREGQDFFPLTVDYREKAAAAGKFPGGYFKREGRPTEKEILTSRMIDRPIRPLFPKGWFNEVQVQSILLSADGENDPDILAINGASAALMVSDIPWAGPLGAVRVGRVKGQFVANPVHAQRLESELDLVYVGSESELVMFEGSANELPEADFIAALEFAHLAIQPLITAQKELAAKVGRPKREITLTVVPDEILNEAKALAGDRIVPALLTPGKLAREAAWKALTDEVGAKLVEKLGAEKVTPFVLKDAFAYIQKEAVRSLMLDAGKRLDGRGFDEIRPISSKVGLLPRAHGSALFSRGETQALALVTLGTKEDAQEIDAYAGGESEKQFILHYNFPNFSVGETGRIMGPGRREIGHGALAERSIEPMVPLKEFPYAVRVTSEIMESNGSTSMASVCAGSLALMDAGVPLIRPVAGISAGLCTEYNAQGKIARYQLLTDIIGSEDFFGDMDCKIAGTEKGITGFQLDLKLKGLPHAIMAEAVEKLRVARLKILEIMATTLAEPRKELSKYAPRILTLKINPEKIGALIGPGGKNIKRIVDESGCEINIEDDGTVQIYSRSAEGMEVARREIEAISAEIEIGKLYRGKVVTIKEFGAFVEVLPGKDGLVHISELANFRVKQTEDIVKLGDEIWVKCLGVDEKGRVRLSRKAAMEELDKKERERLGLPPKEPAPEEESAGENRESSAPREGRESRGFRERGDRGDRGGDRGRRDQRGGRGPRDGRGPREPRESREPREPRADRESRGSREAAEPAESRDSAPPADSGNAPE
ncbi:MAG: polyribonucleotide nucleotidyltransferase [Verrucomicrobia bacterium]|nr:polyribonucleotide nucleotidyltransferase [Verrucomicrobiota bacterium]